ncbi:hypothetical protein BZA77DRAFT_44445 [Pyronema omphalodes]|nr:hypothetical protein BZA77DRAFT_44445 [Pyronema omphalodes]
MDGKGIELEAVLLSTSVLYSALLSLLTTLITLFHSAASNSPPPAALLQLILQLTSIHLSSRPIPPLLRQLAASSINFIASFLHQRIALCPDTAAWLGERSEWQRCLDRGSNRHKPDRITDGEMRAMATRLPANWSLPKKRYLGKSHIFWDNVRGLGFHLAPRSDPEPQSVRGATRRPGRHHEKQLVLAGASNHDE